MEDGCGHRNTKTGKGFLCKCGRRHRSWPMKKTTALSEICKTGLWFVGSCSHVFAHLAHGSVSCGRDFEPHGVFDGNQAAEARLRPQPLLQQNHGDAGEPRPPIWGEMDERRTTARHDAEGARATTMVRGDVHSHWREYSRMGSAQRERDPEIDRRAKRGSRRAGKQHIEKARFRGGRLQERHGEKRTCDISERAVKTYPKVPRHVAIESQGELFRGRNETSVVDWA